MNTIIHFLISIVAYHTTKLGNFNLKCYGVRICQYYIILLLIYNILFYLHVSFLLEIRCENIIKKYIVY